MVLGTDPLLSHFQASSGSQSSVKGASSGNMAGHDGASVKGNDKAKRMMVNVKVQVQTLVVRLQKTLLEASVTPKELNRAVRVSLLRDLNRWVQMQYFVPNNLTDVIEERASSGAALSCIVLRFTSARGVGLCGWPLCSAAISTKTKRTGAKGSADIPW